MEVEIKTPKKFSNNVKSKEKWKSMHAWVSWSYYYYILK